MHILFLTDNFPPEVNAPATRTHEHCREWVKAGHDVTVITCAPNFPKGQLFEGYRNRLLQTEEMDGIRVVRVWTYITANDGFARRILDYMSFMAAAVLASPFVRRPDVVVSTSPQFFCACAGFVVSRLKRVPFVFELRDLWPESIRAVGAMKNAPALDVLEKLELFLYRKADRIIPVTRSFRQNLIKRGVDGEKIHIVTNGADLSRFYPTRRDMALASALGFEGKFIAGYVGTHGLAHALETVLVAARQLQDEGRQDIQFMMLGEGAAKAGLVARAAEMGLANVTFLDSVPRSEVARYWSLVDVSIIHLRNTGLFTTVIPSKLFECMAMGVPVLHGVPGESAAIVEQECNGLSFEPENPASLCARLIELYEDPALRRELSENGRLAARKFDRKVLAAGMLGQLEETADRSQPNSRNPAAKRTGNGERD